MNSFLYFTKFICIIFLLYYFYLKIINLCKYIQDKYIKIEISFLVFLFSFLYYICMKLYKLDICNCTSILVKLISN